MPRFLVAPITLAALLLAPSAAFAAKVAVLRFAPSGRTPGLRVEEARTATRVAVIQRSHTLPSDAELSTAEVSTRDGRADTRAEYRNAGRAAGAEWTVAGEVTEREDGTYRVELEVCQVETGRIESLAREVTPEVAPAQVGEMLGFLLRPEGLAGADVTWTVLAPARVKPKPPSPPPVPPPPAPPPTALAVRHAYAEDKLFTLGLGVDARAPVARPANARGAGSSFGLHAAGGYAVQGVPGLELRAALGTNVAGPSSFRAELGARYMFQVAPTVRFFIGPEATIGGFFALGADRSPRFLAHGSVVAALGVGSNVQLELAGDGDIAAGGAGTLVLAGGSARVAARF